MHVKSRQKKEPTPLPKNVPIYAPDESGLVVEYVYINSVHGGTNIRDEVLKELGPRMTDESVLSVVYNDKGRFSIKVTKCLPA